MKLFAAVHPSGQFDFNSIRTKRKDVVITRSDAEYGGLVCKPVEMQTYEEDLPPPNSNDDFSAWNDHKIAWVWQNYDGSFWLDTLSLTAEDARSWASNPAQLENIGTKLVAVRIQLR